MRIETKPIDYDSLIGGRKPQPKPPAMKMKYNRTIKQLSPLTQRITDSVELANGKRITILTEKFEGKKTNKLAYLTDNIGNWIKSKLTYYNSVGRKTFERISEAK